MKKLLSMALVLVMIASMLVVGVSAKAGDTDTWDGTADTSWYDANPNATEFVIMTEEQFMGIAEVVKSDTFEGQTIKLGADITLNTGDATTWRDSAPLNQSQTISKEHLMVKDIQSAVFILMNQQQELVCLAKWMVL